MNTKGIQNMIYTLRGVQVMLDRDLAQLYEVETKVLNQAVKRNADRFPERFMFRLTEEEISEVLGKAPQIAAPPESGVSRSQNVTMKQGRGYNIKYRPFAFTEQGVSQLSAVLRSKAAIEMSIRIIDAFVAMRRFLSANYGIFQRLEQVERHQMETDQKIEKVLDCLEEGTLKEKAHIFSAGQVMGFAFPYHNLVNIGQQ